MNVSLYSRHWRSASIMLPRVTSEFINLSMCGNCRSSIPTSISVCPSVGSKRWKVDDRKDLIKSTPLKDMGTQGENLLDVDLVHASTQNVYPDVDTPNTMYDGVRFADLPICYIKSSKNNTLIHITDKLGAEIVFRSCGMDGFKNTRKGTNIAAQTTAIAISALAKEKGVSNVRVQIQGLGPGRMSSVKGLQMAGLKVVSITDATPISWNPPRPRKVRRL